jgi:hypothetical protein
MNTHVSMPTKKAKPASPGANMYTSHHVQSPGVAQIQKAPQGEDGVCYVCKNSVKEESSKKTIQVPAPYYEKIVCAHCGTFLQWGKQPQDEAKTKMDDRIDAFFKNTNLSSPSNKIYQSFFYQWTKSRLLTPRQMEIMYKHSSF